MSRPTAIGCHAYTGTFSQGVAKHFDVLYQLGSTDAPGAKTAARVFGVACYLDDYAKWPRHFADLIFTSPRAYKDDVSFQYQIKEFEEYAAGNCQVAIMEVSARNVFTQPESHRYTTNLVRFDRFREHGYRVAYIYFNSMLFEVPQDRKRCFIVWYKPDANFNIEPYDILPFYPTVCDAIWELREHSTFRMRADHLANGQYSDGHAYLELSKIASQFVDRLPNGWTLKVWDEYSDSRLDWTDPRWDRECDQRIQRLNWLRPAWTLTGDCGRQMIHPQADRPVTLYEAALLAGWWDGFSPIGPNPYTQIALSVPPNAAEWIARQALLYIDNHWATEDWYSTYDGVQGVWSGANANGAREKVFNLLDYVGHFCDEEKYTKLGLWKNSQPRRFPISPEKIAESKRRFSKHEGK